VVLKHHTAFWFPLLSLVVFAVFLSAEELVLIRGGFLTRNLLWLSYAIILHIALTLLVYYASVEPDLRSAQRGKFTRLNGAVLTLAAVAVMQVFVLLLLVELAQPPAALFLFFFVSPMSYSSIALASLAVAVYRRIGFGVKVAWADTVLTFAALLILLFTTYITIGLTL